MGNICSVKISAPPRGMTAGALAVFTPSQAVVTWSWGLQPATALVEWVSADAPVTVVAASAIEITLAGVTFYGLTDNVVTRTASDGISVLQEFRDNREFLMWDVIYAAFNLHDARMVNGRYQKRYRHLLPGDYDSNAWSWTDAPYTAAQIFDLIFSASTVQSPWVRVYHSLLNQPVYDLDWTGGAKLGQCLVDVTEKTGLTFTLANGPYTLVWILKGVGALPAFPAGTSENRRTGSALSGNPTRVRILGERNQYQIFNCPLEKDWKPAWEAFWNFGLLVDDVFHNETLDAPLVVGVGGAVAAGTAYKAIPGDADGVIGYQLAGARARLLTVRQYAKLRDARSGGTGEAFRDYRRFQARSRLDVPASQYLSQLLFRAFKLADAFVFRGYSGGMLGRFGYTLDAPPSVDVTHDPVTGVQVPDADGYGTYLVPGQQNNGYAVALGYQVGQDAFRTLNPDYFDVLAWINFNQTWQHVAFQIDESGDGTHFLLFDDPVINSGDLIAAASTARADGSPGFVLNGVPTFRSPQVQATLNFYGERFSYVAGGGARDDVENVAGLNGQFLKLAPGSTLVEQAYADGALASDKAAALGATLLNRQLYYQNGGYVDQTGQDGVVLSSTVDRVTWRWNAAQGLTKDVDFTNERSRIVSTNAHGGAVVHLEPERAFERREQLNALLPGQDLLRQEARQLKLASALNRINPKMQRTLVDTFHLLFGLDAPPQTVLLTSLKSGGAVTLAAGTPLYRSAVAKVAVVPSDSAPWALSDPIFLGVTTLENQSTAGGVLATATGAGGVIQARVLGPVEKNSPVGYVSGTQTYLQAGPTLITGVAQEKIASGVVRLIRVQVSAAAGGGGFQGEYDPAKSYAAGSTMIISATLTIAGQSVPRGLIGVPPTGTDKKGNLFSGSLPANPTGFLVPRTALPAVGTQTNAAQYIIVFCQSA